MLPFLGVAWLTLAAIASPAPASPAPGPLLACTQRGALTDQLLTGFSEITSQYYISALADFETEGAMQDACADGWCSGADPLQARLRAGYAYAGAAAAYFGLGEAREARDALDHATRALAKIVADARAPATLHDASQTALAYAASVAGRQAPVTPTLCAAAPGK